MIRSAGRYATALSLVKRIETVSLVINTLLASETRLIKKIVTVTAEMFHRGVAQ